MRRVDELIAQFETATLVTESSELLKRLLPPTRTGHKNQP